MNILSRFLVFVGFLLVLALFGALIGPSFVDWDQFKNEFEQEATRLVGQPVKVGGDTKIQFLPLPSVSFQNLAVGENDDGTPLMTVEAFSLNAELFPFLSGEVRIVDMEMLRPHLNLQVGEKGTIAWTNPEVQIVEPEQINIEKLDIVDGSISISGLTGGRTLQLEQIKANLNAGSIVGPWRISATAEVEGVPSNISISTGTYQESGEIRLKAEIDRKDNPYTLLIDGPLKLEDETLYWRGDFDVIPFATQRLEQMETLAEPLPVAIEGKFVAQPKNIELPEYRFEIGDENDPYIITGIGNISIDNEITFIAQADGRQIDLDRIREAEGAEKRSGSLETRINTLRGIIEKVPVPKIKGEIDLILPAIVAGDTYIRDVSAKISPIRNGWDLRFFNATFPGNTLLEADGRVGLFSDFGFNGKLLLASRQPSGFANWVSGEVSPEFRKLKAAGFSADVTISDKQTTFQNLELQLDDARLKGKLQRIASIGKRPAIIAQLTGNRVNIDDLRAIYSLAQDNDASDNLVTHDLNVTIEADVFEANVYEKPIVADGVSAKVSINDGRVSLDRLKAEKFYGASIQTSGRIENILTRPDGNLKLEIDASNAAELLNFVKEIVGEGLNLTHLLDDPDLLENTKISAELETRAQENGAKGQIIVAGISGGTNVDFQLQFDGNVNKPAALPMEINASLINKDPHILLQQAGINTVPKEIAQTLGGEITGELKTDIFLKGIGNKGMKAQILVLNEEATLSAEGLVSFADMDRYEADLELTIGSSNLVPVLVSTGIRVPGLESETPLPASLSAKYKRSKDGHLFEDLAGQVSGNTFTGNLFLREKEVSRPRLEGELTVNQISSDVLTETVFGADGGVPALSLLDDRGRSFQEALFVGYDARLKLAANELKLNSRHKGENARLELVMLDGKLNLNDIQFDYLGGVLTGSASLQNTSGTVLMNGNLFLQNADGGALLEAENISNSISNNLTLTATLETTGRSLDALIRNMAGDGIVDITKIEVDGFTPTVFENVLKETNDETYEITPENVADLIISESKSSKMQLAKVNVPYSISRGGLRVRNVVQKIEDTQLTGDLRYDFPEAKILAELAVLYTPSARERIAGADPQVKFLWNKQNQLLEERVETAQLESYLSLRAFENSQRRIETLEARVLETQRHQREIAFALTREKFRVRKAEAERLKAELEEKQRLEEAARKQAEEKARRSAEEARLQERQKQREAERRKREEQRRLADQKRERARAQNSERVLQDIDKLLFGIE